MSSISGWIKQHALISYFVLAYILTWVTLPLVTVNPLMGLLGLFGPALAAAYAIAALAVVLGDGLKRFTVRAKVVN
jgi:hypothetical protein